MWCGGCRMGKGALPLVLVLVMVVVLLLGLMLGELVLVGMVLGEGWVLLVLAVVLMPRDEYGPTKLL